ncbi:hypothetical protein [Streptomyces aureus]|uniref:hypothetical protein n=1 Tax=Streptomyces aureus TaxID=193461 RepID=UPI0033EAF5A9
MSIWSDWYSRCRPGLRATLLVVVVVVVVVEEVEEEEERCGALPRSRDQAARALTLRAGARPRLAGVPGATKDHKVGQVCGEQGRAPVGRGRGRVVSSG